MKKALSLLLTLIMCLGLAVPAFAAENDFIIEDGVLVEYTGAGGDIVIPDSVTSIGMAAFMDCTNLTSVIIPNSVTSIEPGAFSECESLTGVTIPNSVTSIGNGAFHGCASLTSVTIPNGITNISYETFRFCTSLTSVTLPSSVTSIMVGAFQDCASLKDVYYGGSEAQWKSVTIDDNNEALKSATVHYNGGTVTPAKPAAAMPTNDKLTVNGKLADPTVYKIGDSNYFKIRDVAALLDGTEKQFSVGYDNALKSVTATTGQGYAKQDSDLMGAPTGGNQTATPSNDTIYVNGQKIDAAVYKIDGSNYFKLRDLGKALNFSVDWSRDAGMMIDTSKPYSE